MLALELLKILLENTGETFRTSDKFSSAIKQYLCLSLLKNCSTTIPQALALSCSLFLTLLAKFRHSLKAEIGVFFPMLLLRAIEPAAAGTTPNAAGGSSLQATGCSVLVLLTLECLCQNVGPWCGVRPLAEVCPAKLRLLPSRTLRVALGQLSGVTWCVVLKNSAAPTHTHLHRFSPFVAGPGGAGPVDIAHKAVVLRCLQAMCESGQLLVDLFVNYDCDLEGANLFERMVTALVRLAQGGTSADEKGPAATEEAALRLQVMGAPRGRGVAGSPAVLRSSGISRSYGVTEFLLSHSR